MNADQILDILRRHRERAQAASEYPVALHPHAIAGAIELSLLKTIMKEIDDGSDNVRQTRHARSEVTR